MKKTRSICFSFMCQAGELELKALLLVASLRHHNLDINAELIAAIPDENLWGEVSQSTKSLLTRLGVKLQSVVSPFGKEYPIGNKFSALGVVTDADVTVFLDSDILCLRAFDEQDFATDGLLAKPADLNTFSYDAEQWQQAYKLYNLELPDERVLSSVSSELMLPYFNAGVIAVANGPIFGQQWLQVANKIDADESITNKRPWLDQIALPITAKKMSFSFNCFTEQYNFPAHLRPLIAGELPTLCHYHWPAVVEQEAELTKLVGLLLNKYSEIAQLIDIYPEWKGVKKRASLQNEKKGFIKSCKVNGPKISKPNNFLITGLPRSGASLLCNLLHGENDVVVINEPLEIFPALQDEAGLKFKLYYRQLRTDIFLGKEIQNKINEQGNVIEDDRVKDVRRSDSVPVKKENFCLGTKNPLVYLSRLRLLCESTPEMPKIVMIRHPYETISSWKRSFSHLEQVDLQRFPFGDNEILLDDFQKKSLMQIRGASSLMVKRALLWRYLAELIWRDRDRAAVVRYEDLLASPKKVLKELSSLLGVRGLADVDTKHIRKAAKKCELDKHERQIITMICRPLMDKWGYEK